MFVLHRPLAFELLKTHGQAEVQGTSGRAFAMHVAGYECDVIAGRCFHIARRKGDVVTLVLEKKIPRLIVRLQTSNFVWKVVHQNVSGMLCKDPSTITSADRRGPIRHDFPYNVAIGRRHGSLHAVVGNSMLPDLLSSCGIDINAVFVALADPTRRSILQQLIHGEVLDSRACQALRFAPCNGEA